MSYEILLILTLYFDRPFSKLYIITKFRHFSAIFLFKISHFLHFSRASSILSFYATISQRISQFYLRLKILFEKLKNEIRLASYTSIDSLSLNCSRAMVTTFDNALQLNMCLNNYGNILFGSLLRLRNHTRDNIFNFYYSIQNLRFK